MPNTINQILTGAYVKYLDGPTGFTLTPRNGSCEFYVGDSVTDNLLGHMLRPNDMVTWRMVTGQSLYIRGNSTVTIVLTEEDL